VRLSSYRPPEDARDPRRFARWLRALWGTGASGVYVIRDARTLDVLYVGESHTGRLYDTLTRHFQVWPGRQSRQTYERTSVDVAIAVVPARAAVSRQNELIERLEPRHNVWYPASAIDSAGDDEIPF
jgi:hypothetical protein